MEGSEKATEPECTEYGHTESKTVTALPPLTDSECHAAASAKDTPAEKTGNTTQSAAQTTKKKQKAVAHHKNSGTDFKKNIEFLLACARENIKFLEEKLAKAEAAQEDDDDDDDDDGSDDGTIELEDDDKPSTSRNLRYPKRNIPRKNYKEDDVPVDDDDFLYCDDCETEYEGSCPVHGPLKLVKNKTVPRDGSVPDRAKLTLPDVFSLCQSRIKGAGLGVWTEIDLPKGLVFGPYEGKITYDLKEAHKSGFCWQVNKKGKPHHYIEAVDASVSNWLRYVNCANNEHHQNLIAFQYKGNIYYRTYKPVPRFCELLVWYGDEYAQEMGIDLQDDPEENFQKFLNNPGIKVFRCEKCQASFTSEEVLQGHRKRHRDESGKRKHKCKLCNYSSDDSSHVKIHMRTHTGEKPYVCKTCGKGFSRMANLKRHCLRHTGERPHACKTCGQKFTQSGHLRDHVRTHFSEKPFMCNTCGMCFTKKGDLVTHERIHSGLMPYSCSYCQKRFSDHSSVRTHMIHAHTREFPHKCPDCGKGFMCPSHVKRHQEKKHSAHEE